MSGDDRELGEDERDTLLFQADVAKLNAEEALSSLTRQITATSKSLNQTFVALTGLAKRVKAAEDTEFEAISMHYDDGWDLLRKPEGDQSS